MQVHSAGQLLTRDFVSMLPFTDELVVLELSGGAVLTALETGVGSYPALEGRFLQVGGQTGCSVVVQGRALVQAQMCIYIALAWLPRQLTPLPPSYPPTTTLPPSLSSSLRLLDSSLPPCPAQVSGIRFEFDPSRPAGSRIVPGSVELAGEPLETDRLYKASWALYCPVLLRSALYSIC